MRAQGKVVEGVLVLYIRGNLFVIKVPKHWTKEAGQSFSQEEFESREDKCVQTGPTPPVQKDREIIFMLSPGFYIGDIFSNFINYIKIKTLIQKIQN